MMFWNANNTYGFDRVNWRRLNDATTITTVSKYMKHIMWRMGLNPLVIPNGIPRSLLRKVDDERVGQVKNALDADVVLFKMARWHPDKRWNAAVEATARLKEMGLKTVLVARGGIEPYGREVAQNARSLGLTVGEARTNSAWFDGHLCALREAAPADVIDVKFHLPLYSSRVLYRAVDGVLANSGHEPFGIVGLEAMAAGGIAYTGCTGEDYAIPLVNSFVLETDDPLEIVGYVTYLRETPQEDKRMRKAARRTARQFTWESAVRNLVGKLTNQARVQGILPGRAEPAPLPLFEVEEGPEHLEQGPASQVKSTEEVINDGQNTEAGCREALGQCAGGARIQVL
jgi:glycosyltransferase involved in cell wall biosynthesis